MHYAPVHFMPPVRVGRDADRDGHCQVGRRWAASMTMRVRELLMRSPRLRTLLAFACMFILGGGAFAPPEQFTNVYPAAAPACQAGSTGPNLALTDVVEVSAQPDSDANQPHFR